MTSTEATASPERQRGSLAVGFARAELTTRLGMPLAGVIARGGRACTRIRDQLYCRALTLVAQSTTVTLLVADLLVVTERLHEAVANKAGLPREALLFSATHTHSAPGGYWDAGRGELFMGRYDPDMFDELVETLASTIRAASSDTQPARLHAASCDLIGASANRRRLHGPVDRELSLLRFERDDAAPIDLVSFGAHPVIGSEREPGVCSADFPGELCRRLEAGGSEAIFLTGAVGGLSPLFPEFPLRLDEHLDLVAGLLERGVERAIADLVLVPDAELQATRLQIPLTTTCELFPRRGGLWALAELASTPLKRWMLAMARDGLEATSAALHLVRFGQVALVGTPCDLGVTVALALKEVLHQSDVRYPLVGSQCNGYVGYVHLPEDYELTPEEGFRQIAFYENAMSLSGRKLGAQLVSALRDHLTAVP